MPYYRKNSYRADVVRRFGQTAGLPLFENSTSKPLSEPTKSRFENAPKALQLATDTRRLAHTILRHNKPALSTKQLAVLDALKQIGPATNEEIAHYLGWPINRVVGRTFELRQFGVVVPDKKRPCQITGNVVWAWKVK
jgi:hypothetical protein